MEIQPSIISQALYGEQGRVAVPLSVFIKQSKGGQIGGKKDIQHLGVPMVLALVNINMNKPCNNPIEHSYDNPIDEIAEYRPEEFAPISDEVYDSLFNTVLDEPSESESEYLPGKKYTRKNRNYTDQK
jgi:hypothetical protein